ncbi:MAG: phage recombination protein Bet [Gemmatimonadota bacterium]|nr:phage recombination protein Bet [Gemmatimonadota bacterium]
MTNASTTISADLQTALTERGIEPHAWSALQNLYPGAQPESMLMVVDYCKARKLDPLKKPVHIVPMYVEDKKTGAKGMRDVVMPGIYEYRTTAFRTGDYAGQDEPVFGPSVEFQGITVPEWCRITVYRIIQGEKCAFSNTAFYREEYATRGRNDDHPNAMWAKRCHGQLAKVAEAGALRKAFPNELGGDMTAEEMTGKIIDVTGESYADDQKPSAAAKLNAALDSGRANEATEPQDPGITVEDLISDAEMSIAMAETSDDIKKIGERIKTFPKEARDALRSAWKKRQETIAAGGEE